MASCSFVRGVAATIAACGCAVASAGPTVDPADVARRDAALLDRVRRAREALEWTDEVVRHDWRLQRRPGTDECRVLDPDERIVCAGTGDSCRRELARLCSAGRVPGVRGPTVILLHGLGEGRGSMRPLAAALRGSLDATVMTFGYASVKADIDAHARALGAVVADLPAAARVHFVGHSLGNLVVRRWMAVAPAADLGRVGRMVMLGPPNQGADMARMAAKIWGVAARAEGAARDLVVDWETVAPGLAVPPCEFGIVAGGRGDDVGFSPLLAGDDDAVVRVAETRLDGAADFLVVPVHHASMMDHADVQRATAAFLQDGRFPARSAEPAGTGEPR
ncbi:MAG: esterase/lipase family protein [Planctomycetaceae bacterium]